MAKLGYLYLRDGVWDDEQILPLDWVNLSSKGYYQNLDPLEPWNLYYGYLWWVHEDGSFAAHGFRGQFIYLFPENDLVVVITGDLSEADFVKPQIWIREYLLPALNQGND